MATLKATHRLTKKAFLEKVTHGTLSADQVLAKLLTELQQRSQAATSLHHSSSTPS